MGSANDPESSTEATRRERPRVAMGKKGLRASIELTYQLYAPLSHYEICLAVALVNDYRLGLERGEYIFTWS